MQAIETRLARGDEAVMHGLFHLDEGGEAPISPFDWLKRRCYTATEGEFSALDQSIASERLEQGLDRFTRIGWPVRGFVAPAWLMSRGTRTALTRSPFRYTSTRAHLYRLPDWQPLGSPSLVWSLRSAWRQRISASYNQWLYRTLQHTPLLRLGLHPVDAIHPQTLAFWTHTLRSALERRIPMTKAAWLGVER
jgi:predicted deacetylase